MCIPLQYKMSINFFLIKINELSTSYYFFCNINVVELLKFKHFLFLAYVTNWVVWIINYEREVDKVSIK